MIRINLRRRKLLLPLPNLRRRNLQVVQIRAQILYQKEGIIEDYPFIQYKREGIFKWYEFEDKLSLRRNV